MDERFIRTQMLLGEEALQRLEHARVAVFGLGGVGGYVVEALARSGIGALDFIDHDRVSRSNINRQILADETTIGQLKTEVARERVARINPQVQVQTYPVFYLPETAEQFDFRGYDYVVDAIDTVTAKIGLILQAREAGVPVISAMGAGNKLDPTAFRVADIYQTFGCPLAKVMRQELRKRGVERLKVVFSPEPPLTPLPLTESEEPGLSRKRQTPGSVAFVPSVAGLILAGEVIRDLAGISETKA